MNFFGGIPAGSEIPDEVLTRAQEMSNDPELLSFVKAALPAALLRYPGEVTLETCHIIAKDALLAAFSTLTLTRANLKSVNDAVAKARAKNEN